MRKIIIFGDECKMKSLLKKIFIAILICLVTVSAVSPISAKAAPNLVYTDIKSAVEAFRANAKDWPAEITIAVDKKLIDSLCLQSGFTAWEEFRQQFVTCPEVEADDMLWLYGVQDNSDDGGAMETAEAEINKQSAYIFKYRCAITKAQVAEMDAAARQITDSLALGGMTEFEKVKAVYDWFTHKVTSPNGSSTRIDQTPYGALVKKEAVCAGIGIGMEKILSLAGVECRYISGYAYKGQPGRHGWNIVKVNGKYYYMDATWDLKKARYEYFLTNEAVFTKSGSEHIGFGIFGQREFKDRYPIAAANFLADGTGGFSNLKRKDAFTSFTAAAYGDGAINLAWSGVEGASKYTVEIYFPGSGSWQAQKPVTELSHAYALSPEKGLGWRVRTDTGIISEALYISPDEAGRIVGNLYPSVPYLTYCESMSSGQASVRWTAAEDVSDYTLYMSVNGGNYEPIYTTSENSCVIKGLVSGGVYRFALTAKGKNGISTSIGDAEYAEVRVK